VTCSRGIDRRRAIDETAAAWPCRCCTPARASDGRVEFVERHVPRDGRMDVTEFDGRSYVKPRDRFAPFVPLPKRCGSDSGEIHGWILSAWPLDLGIGGSPGTSVGWTELGPQLPLIHVDTPK